MTDLASRPPLAITCGDPAGIGPEVIAAALRSDPLAARDCVFIGPEPMGRSLQQTLGVNYCPVGPSGYQADPGHPTAAGAALALAAMELA
ncbi:MAG: 4-hydroxythreonine-4-phosphate dehydrogenase, partial [Puniceicoccaceae bacterium]